MDNFFKEHKLQIGEKRESVFLHRNNIMQDGTSPMYRDVDGKLWAMSGQAHSGHIGVFCGTKVDDLKEMYPIKLNFCTGHSDYAFDNIKYPEGVKPRGSIWPFGLYICPNTHRFFCFVHNETGWDGRGTGYDSFGICETPKYDSDFRHVGLMHSDDEGQSWTFDRWVLTGEEACFSENFNPDNVNVIGQKGDVVCLGSGDFSLFVDPNSEYMYIFYNKSFVNLKEGYWEGCHTYMARTRKRTDGIMGDFVKYYNGTFCEPGNFGKETAIIENAWHSRAIYLKKYDLYLGSSVAINPKNPDNLVADYMTLRTSKDLIHWSDPISFEKDGEKFGAHYCALYPNDDKNPITIIEDDEFLTLTNTGNVYIWDCELK